MQENLRLDLNTLHLMFDLFDLFTMQTANTRKEQHSKISCFSFVLFNLTL